MSYRQLYLSHFDLYPDDFLLRLSDGGNGVV